MTRRCQREAESVLGNYFEALAEMVTDCVRDYHEFYGKRAHLHEAWTRCSIIRDEIKGRMVTFCEATDGFQVIHDGNATFFGAKSKFIIRIKKLFDNLHANTGKTQLSFDFDHQSHAVQGDLIESLDATNLYLGYVTTENDPLNPPVYLVCNDPSGEIELSIHLNAPARPPTDTLQPRSSSPIGSVSEPRRVRVKKGAAEKKASNG
jgi:hypothetical protein